MRILVTGASGFIGSHVVRSLLTSKHTVLGFALPDDNLWRLKDIAGQFELLSVDLRERGKICNCLRDWRPQACIHLAWYTEPGKYLHSRENLTVLESSLALLQDLYEYGCEHFVGAGSCAEYEMKDSLLGELDSTKPETLYAASKLSFNLLGEQIALQYGKKFSWGRIFYLYGPYEGPRRFVPGLILSLKNEKIFLSTPGEQVRDYLHVEDVANAFVYLTENSANGIYNICSGQAVSIREMLEICGNIMRRPDLLRIGAIPYRDWEPMYICGNNERLQSLGWKAKYNLETGLRQTVSWWYQRIDEGFQYENRA